MDILKVILTILLQIVLVESNPSVITIAGVLSDPKFEKVFKDAVSELNNKEETRIPGSRYRGFTELMNGNPIRSGLNLCENFLPQKIFAVVVSHPPGMPYQPPISVSYTCGFYKIPVIGISARDSVFSNMNLHQSYLRTVPPFSHQAHVWVKLVRHFDWKRVIILHSADQEGRAMVAKFQNEIGPKEVLDKNPYRNDVKIEIASVVDYKPGKPSFTNILKKISEDDTMVFLLSATKNDAETIFRDVHALNMSGPGYVWIVTEQALEAANIPEGAIGMRLKNGHNETVHVLDSVEIIGRAFRTAFLNHSSFTDPPDNCKQGSSVWSKNGTLLYKYLINQKIEKGHFGQVQFDDVGDRTMPVYEIINVQKNKKEVMVGIYGNSSEQDETLLTINNNDIIWPGNVTVKPEGFKMLTHLKAVTIASLPFVFVREVESPEDCDPKLSEIYCPRPNTTDPYDETPFCCKGYCIDMLREVSSSENFTFDLHLVADNKYGSLVQVWMPGHPLLSLLHVLPFPVDPGSQNTDRKRFRIFYKNGTVFSFI